MLFIRPGHRQVPFTLQRDLPWAQVLEAFADASATELRHVQPCACLVRGQQPPSCPYLHGQSPQSQRDCDLRLA
jgi:hypothetical protein